MPDLDKLARGLTEAQREPPILMSDTTPFVHHLQMKRTTVRIKRAQIERTTHD